jgi:hypothetical protein
VAGGDDPESTERRNGAFKLIPKIVKGSWLVKQSVGETPVLLGRKLTTKYFRCGAPGLGWADRDTHLQPHLLLTSAMVTDRCARYAAL